MADNLLGVVGIIMNYLSIFVTMLAAGIAFLFQAKAFERSEEHTSIGRGLRKASYAWFVGAVVFLGLAMYLIVKL